MDMCCAYFSIVPAVQGKHQGFLLYRDKWQCNIKQHSVGEKGRGLTNWQSPQCGAFSSNSLNEKSKSSIFPGARGAYK